MRNFKIQLILKFLYKQMSSVTFVKLLVLIGFTDLSELRDIVKKKIQITSQKNIKQ